MGRGAGIRPAALFLFSWTMADTQTLLKRGQRRRNLVMSAMIGLLAVEAAFLTAFIGVISVSLWQKTRRDNASVGEKL